MNNLALNTLQDLALKRQLAHAWLFEAAQVANNLDTIKLFAQWLLCSNRNARLSCNRCKSCQLLAAHTNPDLLLLEPQTDSSHITIDAVRTVSEFVISPPQLSEYKVVIIYPANAMNTPAYNALLKSLEEPLVNVVFLLLTTNHKLLPATIVSRCQRLLLPAPSNSAKISNDKQMTLADDLLDLWVRRKVTAVEISEKWCKEEIIQLLHGIELFAVDLLLYKYTNDVSKLHNLDESRVKVGQGIDVDFLWSLGSRLREARLGLVMQQRLNVQLVLEDILFG